MLLDRPGLVQHVVVGDAHSIPARAAPGGQGRHGVHDHGQSLNSRRFAQTAYDIVAPALRKAAGKPNGDTPAGGMPTSAEGGATAVQENLIRFTGTFRGKESGTGAGVGLRK